MPTILTKVKQLRDQARVAGDKTDLGIYTFVLGELERNFNKCDDAVALSVIKKIIAGNRETMAVVTDTISYSKLRHENEILEQFLPKLLSEEQIIALIESDDTVKTFMPKVKQHALTNQMDVDMKQAKELFTKHQGDK